MSSYDAVSIIEEALRSEVVNAGGLRLRPATDEQIALNIIEALEAAGLKSLRRIHHKPTLLELRLIGTQ